MTFFLGGRGTDREYMVAADSGVNSPGEFFEWRSKSKVVTAVVIGGVIVVCGGLALTAAYFAGAFDNVGTGGNHMPDLIKPGALEHMAQLYHLEMAQIRETVENIKPIVYDIALKAGPYMPRL
jgi:hypothetical protein